MLSPNINFFAEDINFNLPNTPQISEWILMVIHSEKKIISEVNFIFTSDSYLLNINISYLNHNYFTDVITFDRSDNLNIIEGDIFISIERVKANSLSYNVDFINELHRVIIHGILHLIGFMDNKFKLKKIMRQKEDYYLSLLKF